ncbi:MAG: hypothetical protein AAFN77_23990 [Planctomycetota bacterium]
MIILITARRRIETLMAVFALMFFVAPAISFAQIDESPRTIEPANLGSSVLELSDPSIRLRLLPPDDPFVIQPASISSNVNVSNGLQDPQSPSVLESAEGVVELDEPQILMRGPLHEAFADTHQADPQPNPIVEAAPPEAIQEVPPEFKPEGSNVEWIPGYWAWDDSQSDFIWISGVWRDVPPNQRWVPGYWEQVDNGHRWIAGFWTSIEQQELSYLPAPPANLDRGPSVIAPSDDYFYCPGNWEYQNDNYVWRSGHWQPRVANWIWIPARYIWTPRGCVYRPGYWDRELDVRGTLFAPVHFQQQQHLTAGFQFQPNHCVNTGADFFVHLFVRPNCNHYFYGDWYGQNFVNTGFRPWVQPQSHVRNYDPLLAHYNCSRYRQGNQLLINWVNNQHRHYHRNHDHRPRNTLQAQINFTNLIRDQRQNDFIQRANLVNRFDELVRRRGRENNSFPHNNLNHRQHLPNARSNFVRTDSVDRHQHDVNERLQRAIKNTRKSGEQRSNGSVRNGDRLAKNPPKRQPAKDTRKPGNAGRQSVAERNKIDLPTTRSIQPTTRNDRGQTNGLTRAQIDKARRDQEKANRKRELEQKIAAAKQQAEIKRKQRETARELSERERKDKLEQTRQRIALEKQARQSNRNQSAPRINQRTEDSNRRSVASKDLQRRLEQQRQQQQRQQQAQSGRTNIPKGNQPVAQNASQQTARQKAELAKQQRERAKQQRIAQSRIAAEQAKQAAQQKTAQAREAARQRELQRQRERTAKAQADAQKRNELQARLAREKAQRDVERRAAQQRAQQKAQADAQRRAREKAQRDAQRKAADQARRAADAARKQQRDQEQAARRAKRKKK